MNEGLLQTWFALGGGLGAVARPGRTLAVTHRFPLSTLIVNVVGCLLLGLALVLLPPWPGLSGEEARRLAYGFCGGFTTFSSFAYQTLDLHRRYTLLHAATNIALSLLLCLLTLTAGRQLGTWLHPWLHP
ncbi:MAG: fluoride efflux transporter FluC [Candidatus Competibacterales bacterium]